MNAFNEMLKTSVKNPADKTKKKDLLPEIKLDEALSTSLVKFIDAKTREKIANGEKVLAELPILQYCQDKLDKDALAGTFNSSYKVVGADGKTSVKFITSDRFSVSQDQENIEALKECFAEKFEEHFETKNSIEAKSEIFTDENLQKELVELLGENFSKFFVVTQKYVAKDGFNEKIYKIANGNINTLKTIKTLVPQTKPCFK